MLKVEFIDGEITKEKGQTKERVTKQARKVTQHYKCTHLYPHLEKICSGPQA